jgi:pentafunctional AROM polypeptide
MAKNGHAKVLEIPVIGDSRVLVGSGLLEDVPRRLLAAGITPATFVVISDATVFSHYGPRLVQAFVKEGFAEDAGSNPRVLSYQIRPGEASKSRDNKDKIEDFMLENRCVRNTVVVALGGGVIGDLSGFIAATYMRGVPVIQIPTSTMAMIDSSVGGKTAINVPAGKNLIGAFHQPRFVFADPTLLRTLDRREIVEGLAEAIKMGVIRDSKLFDLMEREHSNIISLDATLMGEVLYQAVRHKADVVAQDPTEKGIRATLNYGHTIGHAFEALLSPRWLHGECVSLGCIAEADLACRMGYLKKECVPRIRACFEAYGLPTEAPAGLELGPLMAKMAVDKKNEGKTIRCTIITDVGKSIDHPQPVPREMMESVVRDFVDAANSGDRHTKAARTE